MVYMRMLTPSLLIRLYCMILSVQCTQAHYSRHAHREYEIHRTMAHPHVVKLLDVFEIDSNAMATVQELCCTGTSTGASSSSSSSSSSSTGSSSGSGYQAQDLDQHLKAHGALPEKEAKSILTQLLRYTVYICTL
jgi:tousled-like kinase